VCSYHKTYESREERKQAEPTADAVETDKVLVIRMRVDFLRRLFPSAGHGSLYRKRCVKRRGEGRMGLNNGKRMSERTMSDRMRERERESEREREGERGVYRREKS
jgi:hypothetical protein